MQASPSPISITPAFSPGPQITHGASVGSFFRWTRDDLYEQCSDHMTEKMPSSTRFGSRPRAFRMRAYSSSLSPCSAMICGVIVGASATSMRLPNGGNPTSLDIVPREFLAGEDEGQRPTVAEVRETGAFGRPGFVSDAPEIVADAVHPGLGAEPQPAATFDHIDRTPPGAVVDEPSREAGEARVRLGQRHGRTLAGIAVRAPAGAGDGGRLAFELEGEGVEVRVQGAKEIVAPRLQRGLPPIGDERQRGSRANLEASARTGVAADIALGIGERR